MGAIAVGVLSGLLASVVFVVALRLMLHPRILISDEMAHGLTQDGHEIFRVKLRNDRRHSEAVKLEFDMVVLTQVATPTPPDDPQRRWLFFRVKPAHPHKYERAAVRIRPVKLISLPKYKVGDREANYALRITSRECQELRTALADGHKTLRLRVYAEHPISGRGKTFEKYFGTVTSAVYGDFPVGPAMKVVKDDAVETALAVARSGVAAPPALATAGDGATTGTTTEH